MKNTLKNVSYYSTRREVKEILKAIGWAEKIKKESLMVYFILDKKSFQLTKHIHLSGRALDSTYREKKQCDKYTIWRTKDDNLWIRAGEGIIWSCYRCA